MSTMNMLRVLLSLWVWLLCAGSVWGGGGTLLWQDRFDHGLGLNSANGVAVKGKRVFAAGRGYVCEDPPGCTVHSREWVVRAHDTKTGVLLWQDQFDRGGGASEAQAIAAASTGVFSAGRGTGCANPPDCTERGATDWVVRANHPKTGALLWQDHLDLGLGINAAEDITVLGKRVFAAGFGVPCETGPCPDIPNWLVRGYDAKTGTLRWQDQFDNGGGRSGADASSITGHDKRVFAAGFTLTCFAPNEGGGCTGAWLVRGYDAKSGALIWHDQFDRGGGSSEADVIVANGRRVFAAGTGRTCDNPPDCTEGRTEGLVRTYDAKTGTLLWHDYFDSGAGYEAPRAMAVKGERVFVVGQGVTCDDLPVCTNRRQEWFVRAYTTKTGLLLWENRFDNGGGSNEASAVAVKGKRVFVAGFGNTCDDPPDCDDHREEWVVRAHDAKTGALLWQDGYEHGGGFNLANAIAAKGKRVFAVGFGLTCFDGSDCDYRQEWLIRAYSTK